MGFTYGGPVKSFVQQPARRLHRNRRRIRFMGSGELVRDIAGLRFACGQAVEDLDSAAWFLVWFLLVIFVL